MLKAIILVSASGSILACAADGLIAPLYPLTGSTFATPSDLEACGQFLEAA